MEPGCRQRRRGHRLYVRSGHTVEYVEIVRYSALRLGLLVLAAALLYWVGLRGALLWITAIVFAFLVAFIAFPRTGDAAAERLKRAVNRTGHAEDRHEDEQVDASEGAALSPVIAETTAPVDAPDGAPSERDL